ncbi:SURF1-domain-containing protein [Rhizodiscina lignyota]|uniref:SURF1-like protein n=1 Tax=Rhizodiscina lignyota TaxID=1504668 RepID=A0A9P4IQ37_9PEZI|nr:SURF1-domain-containing protein [Rhizodiscina lignyota]
MFPSRRVFTEVLRQTNNGYRTSPLKIEFRRATWTCPQCLRLRLCERPLGQKRFASTNAAEEKEFRSILDEPPRLVRMRRKHNYGGLIVLALIPLTAFALGTWQVQRLGWKTDLMARFEDRLVRPPLPLPLFIDPDAVKDFDYRRVYATGKLRHDQEMLVGPRIHDGDDGYLVITPLEREEMDDRGRMRKSKVLVCRGWISKKFRNQRERLKEGGQQALPDELVTVQGLLRQPWKKNMFTPLNKPEKGEWYFPAVSEMAEFVGSQPVWVEETMQPDLRETYFREARGIPIGRAAEVNLRNNHLQYIFTWYGLAVATSFMFWLVVRKPPSDIARRVRQSKSW